MNILMKIDGMSCQHCIKNLKNGLLDVDGIMKADVSLEKKSTSIETERDFSEDELREIIDELGFELVSVMVS